MKALKFQALFVSVMTALLILCQTAQAQQQNQTSAENTRIARLVGLAKVWGAAKYFHPFLPSDNIDWDKALVDAIPKVNTAKTPQEYEAAINSMLAVLNDRYSRAAIPNLAKSAAMSTANKPEAVRLTDGLNSTCKCNFDSRR
jgi:hypothetical protein